MVVDHEVAAVGADGQGWALLGPHEHIQGITDVWLNIVFFSFVGLVFLYYTWKRYRISLAHVNSRDFGFR